MRAITYKTLRHNLEATLNQVCDDRAPVVVARDDQPAVVLMSLEDYEALEETAYLLRSPANAKRLSEAIDALDAGKGLRRKIKLSK